MAGRATNVSVDYALYLESGPKHRKTMAHVFDLLGCTATGPTTAEAIDAAPASIARFRSFLAEHREATDLSEPIEVHVAEHVTEGSWLGNGDPGQGFTPDFARLSLHAIKRHLRVYGYLQDSFASIAAERSRDWLDEAPPGSSWTNRRLLEHVVEAEYEYVRCSLGHLEGLRKAFRDLNREGGDPAASMAFAYEAIRDRMSSLSPEDLELRVQRGAKTWTVARTFRRILEHRWEHFIQLSDRL